MEAFGPFLQLLARSSPWLVTVTIVLSGTVGAWKALRRDVWHFAEQCNARYRLAETEYHARIALLQQQYEARLSDLRDRLIESNARGTEWKARCERWEGLVVANTETLARGTAVVEKVTEAVVGGPLPEGKAG